MSARSEALLELRPGAAIDAIDPEVEVLQVLPPRLAIVTADEASLKAVEGRSDVLSMHTEDVPPDVLERLDEPERLFAAAWNERRRPKERPGEGLSWDAPGFDAP